MYGNDEYGLVSYEEILEFAQSLFGFLSFQLCMSREMKIPSKPNGYKIGIAVLRIREVTSVFNTRVLHTWGNNGTERLTLCQEICNLYPADYFKKLYYTTAFILEMSFWLHSTLGRVRPGLGAYLWTNIFVKNFASEFVFQGGWEGFVNAGNEVITNDMLTNKITYLPEHFTATLETYLPEFFKATLEKAGRLSDVLEVTEQMECLRLGLINIDNALEDEAMEVEENQPREVDENQSREVEENQPREVDSLDSKNPLKRRRVSVDETPQASKSEEKREENRPGKVVKVEKSKEEIEERQTREVGRSDKSGDSSGSRNPLKRKSAASLRPESPTDTPSPSKAKMERK